MLPLVPVEAASVYLWWEKREKDDLQHFAQQALKYLSHHFAQQAQKYLSHHFAQLSIIPNYLQKLTLVLLLLNFKDCHYLVDILDPWRWSLSLPCSLVAANWLHRGTVLRDITSTSLCIAQPHNLTMNNITTAWIFCLMLNRKLKEFSREKAGKFLSILQLLCDAGLQVHSQEFSALTNCPHWPSLILLIAPQLNTKVPYH